jgi:hypothetical protein
VFAIEPRAYPDFDVQMDGLVAHHADVTFGESLMMF